MVLLSICSKFLIDTPVKMFIPSSMNFSFMQIEAWMGNSFRIWSFLWSKVTREPTLDKNWASSQATIPPPRTTTSSGISERSSTSSLVLNETSFKPGRSGILILEPVEITYLSALRMVPSSSSTQFSSKNFAFERKRVNRPSSNCPFR